MGRIATRVVFQPPTLGQLVQLAGLGRLMPSRGRGALGMAGEAVAGLWGSDFRTETGWTQNAVRDGGRWPSHQNAGEQLMRVIPNPGNGFPSSIANVLQIFMVDPAPGVSVGGAFGGGWGVGLEIGAHLYFRYYWLLARTTTAGAGDTNHWWLPEPNNGTIAIHNDNGPRTADGYHWWSRVPDSVAGFHGWTSIAGSQFPVQDVFQFNQAYRIELHYHRTGTNTFTYEQRAFDGSNNTIFDETTSRCNNGNHGAHTNMSATVNTLSNAAHFSNWSGLRWAWEGGGGGYVGAYPSDYGLMSGFAVSAVDWCGPHLHVNYNGTLQ